MGPRAVLLCLLACSTLGCFVFDELDAGQDMMKKPSPPPAKGAPAAAAAASGKPAPPAGPSWWAKARTLASDEMSDDELVRCELGGSPQFMPRPDCLTRGGTPGKPLR